MARVDQVERQLQRLAEAKRLPEDHAAEVVGYLLGHKSSIIVAAAAQLIVDRNLDADTEQLRTAYDRFLDDPTKTDKGCRAKLPLCEALSLRRYEDEQFYIEGIRYIQKDPVYGDPIDVAVNLRGAHAYGLLNCRFTAWTDVIPHLVDLLNDDEAVARAHAARAISEQHSPAAVPLLRHHTQMETDPEVIGECLNGMLQNDEDGDKTLEFVAAQLFSNEEVAVEAADALCRTKNERAIRQVISACESIRFRPIEAAFLSLAVSRQDTAIDYLISLIRTGESKGEMAVRSMAPNRFYEEIRNRVAEAAHTSGSLLIERAFLEHFAIDD